jgi:hypothetical protein
MSTENPDFFKDGKPIFGEEETPVRQEKPIVPPDPRLEALPYMRLGPKSGDRDYGVINSYGLERELPSRIRAPLVEEIFKARSGFGAGGNMGVWHKRVELPDGQIAFYIFEARLWHNSRRVFGDVYIVPPERADEVEAIVEERANAMRQLFIASEIHQKDESSKE